MRSLCGFRAAYDHRLEEQPNELEQALVNSVMRQEIFNLLQDTPEVARRARFCSSVLDYERTFDKHERLSKARKIVTIFIQPGGLFQINVDPNERDELMRGSFSHLSQLKTKYLEELRMIEPLQAQMPSIWEKVYVCSLY